MDGMTRNINIDNIKLVCQYVYINVLNIISVGGMPFSSVGGRLLLSKSGKWYKINLYDLYHLYKLLNNM